PLPLLLLVRENCASVGIAVSFAAVVALVLLVLLTVHIVRASHRSMPAVVSPSTDRNPVLILIAGRSAPAPARRLVGDGALQPLPLLGRRFPLHLERRQRVEAAGRIHIFGRRNVGRRRRVFVSLPPRWLLLGGRPGLVQLLFLHC